LFDINKDLIFRNLGLAGEEKKECEDDPTPSLPMNRDRLSPTGRGAAAAKAAAMRKASQTPLPVGAGVG
jgi:hypothetical protein